MNTSASHGLDLLCHRAQLTHKDISLTSALVLLNLTLVKNFSDFYIQSKGFSIETIESKLKDEKRAPGFTDKSI